MLTYSLLQTTCQEESSDTSAPSLSFFKRNINVGLVTLQGALGSYYTNDTKTDTTIAGTSSYRLPVNCIRLKALTITVSNIEYPAAEIYDEALWRSIKGNAIAQTGDIPMYYFARRDTVEVYPTPASSSNTITLYFESGGKELVADDYTDGTILTLANLGTAVTGSGTTWTSAMANRYLRISSEGNWYKIASFGTTTTLTLADKYQGIAIAAGSEAYRIGEVPNTPQATHILPAYFALWRYYGGVKKDATRELQYRKNWEDGLKDAVATYGIRYSSKVIPSTRGLRRGIRYSNPNWNPQGMT